MSLTGRQLVTELSERDLDAPVIIRGSGDIVDIDYTDDGNLVLIGDSDE